jgi:hypothetical protein
VVTFGDKSVLPVRNRLDRKGPHGRSQNAPRKIIDRCAHPAGCQNLDGLGKLLAVVHWVYPKQFIVRDCESGIFQPHQRNVIHKWQVSRQPTASSDDPWSRNGMQDDTDFNPLAFVSTPE